MDESVSKFLGKLTDLVTDLKDTRTKDAPHEDHPGIIKNAFDKSDKQKKSEDNTNLAEAVAKANAEQRKQEEEDKGRRIMKTVTPMAITSIDPKAAKQLKEVLGSDKTPGASGKGPSAKESEGMFGWLVGLLPMLGTIGTVLMSVIGGIGTAISTVFGIIAGPVGLILLAVAAIAAFFVGFWEEWEESGDFGEAFLAGVGKIFDWLIALPLTLLKDLTTWAMRKMGFEEEADFIDEHWDNFIAILKDVFLAPYTIMVRALENAWDAIEQAWEGVKDFFSGIGALLTGDFEKAGEKFKSAFGNIIGALWDWIWALPNAALNWIFEFLGFKEEGDVDINLGDMLWDTVSAIFDWFKLLFTSPAEAFKKIGDWFDRLFDDPVGAFKELMPDWLVDFGVWVWDHTFGPIVDLWCDIVGDPEGAKQAFLNLMPEWLRDIAEWVWDRTIGPAVELWNYIFDHPDGAKAAFKSLFPEWLWDIMEWIYDHTIGPVVGLFTDLFDGKDVEATFRKYLPDWIVDTFLWIKDTVFGGITEFFGKLFDGDIEGALRAILPDWLVDGLMWVVDTVFGPITEFWDKLFDGDIEGAFRALLPDWLVDFGKWVWESIEPIFGWLGDAFDWLTGDGLANYVKAEYPEVYEKIWGAKKREEQRQKEAQKLAETTGQQALAGGQGEANADFLQKQQEKFNAEVDKMYEGSTDFLATLGHDNSILTHMMDNSDVRSNFRGTQANFKDAIQDSEGSGSGGIRTGDDIITGMLDQLRSKGTIQSRTGEDLLINDHIRGWIGSDAFKTRNWEDNEANRQLLAKVMNTRMYANEYLDASDDVADKFDDDVVELSWIGVDADLKEDVWYKMRQQIWDNIFEAQGLPFGEKAEDFLPIDITTYDDERANEYSFGSVLSPSGAATAKSYLTLWESSGKTRTKPTYATILGSMFENWGLNRDAFDSMAENYVSNAGVPSSDETETLDDFIMRPGMKPVAFNKGDIILGIHEDNPRMATNNSPELINRVDQMVVTLKENKDLQAKMLEAMIESGMMKKQGNTVVNNGGNSTVVNNTTTESNIMSFRDRVVGRISNSSTKYK